jgi:plastocyanin
MVYCDFSVIGVANKTVYMVDMDHGNASITVDAANVVEWVQRKYPRHGVIYCDQEGCWARISVLSNNAIGFWPVETSELPEFARTHVYGSNWS